MPETPTITETGTLPAGVTFASGILSGTPTQVGTFPLTFTATNGILSPATQHFTLTVVGAPTVTGITPSAGPLGGGTSVVISGTNLGSATAVAFGSTPAVITADSATSVTATAPAGTGTVDVTVTTSYGGSATSTADQFTYVNAPVVSAIAPSAGPASGGTSVVISGTDLGSATAVAFGSTPAVVTADSATSVTATAPAGTGTVDVTVTTVGGTSATSAADHFLYGTAPVFTSPTTVTFVAGQAGQLTPVATGAPAPVVTVLSTLPSWLTFTRGVLSGTPPATGATSVTFSASNGVGGAVTQTVTLTVVAVEITTSSLPPATIGTPYSVSLSAVGGVAPYKWKITAGALPKGLKLNAKTGVLSGTVKVSKHAPAPGPYTVTVGVTDSTKHVKLTGSASFTLTLEQ